MDEKMEGLYGINEEFRMYVDRYCKLYGYTVQEALRHKLVHEVAEYYRQKGKEETEGFGTSAGQNNFRGHIMGRSMKKD